MRYMTDGAGKILLIKMSHMKKVTIMLLLLLATISGNAQVKLDDVVKPGTKLIYGVEANGKNYDFIVAIKDKKGTAFNWEMTAPVGMKGKIIHTPKALEDGYKMWNLFGAGTKKLDDQTLSVWISQNLLKVYSKGNSDPVKLYIYGDNSEPVTMASVKEKTLKIIVDGKEVSTVTQLVMPVKQVNNVWKIDAESEDFFMFNNSASFPVIVCMHAGFTIRLKEVRTK